jgi:hypothetical protein
MNQLTASPPDGGVTVSISSNFTINGQPVTITSQDINNVKSGINFSLAQPVALGSIDDFVDWLNKTFGTPITSAQIDSAINGLPDTPAVVKEIKEALLSFLHATITITVLSINTESGVYRFGVTMTLNPAINVLDVLDLDSIGVEIASGTPVTSP